MPKKIISRRRLLTLFGVLTLTTVTGVVFWRRIKRALFRWAFGLKPGGIVIHHSATEPLRQALMNAETIDRMNKKRGMRIRHRGRTYHIAYHYVILPDGTVERGRPEECWGSHTRSFFYNRWIGICLIGSFNPRWSDKGFHRPTEPQMESLVRLSDEIMGRYGFADNRILPHRNVNATECPGMSFPMEEYLRRVRDGAGNA